MYLFILKEHEGKPGTPTIAKDKLITNTNFESPFFHWITTLAAITLVHIELNN